MNITKNDAELLSRIIATLYDWSGVSDETPDDTEIVSSTNSSVTLGDLRDASVLVDNLSKASR